MTSATPGEAIDDSADLLVVGAGPAGSAAAAQAAARGVDVLLIDAAHFPRDKTCGDGLTPRAVAGLHKLGMSSLLDDRPRIRGLELNGWGVR
ncbi:MAG: FAD-dependent oxidoreductase, partial [Gordonia sp. (in: high G+C Gram-positive bacteria)]